MRFTSSLCGAISAVLLLGTACGASKSAAPEAPAAARATSRSGWQVFKPSDGGFAVEMPGKPSEVREALSTEAGPVTSVRYTLDHDGRMALVVGYSTFTFPTMPGAEEAFLDGARDGGVDSVSGVLVHEHRIRLGEYPGRDLVVDVPQEGITMHSRIFLVEKRLFQLLGAVPTSDTARAPEIVRFFESFQLVGDPNGYAAGGAGAVRGVVF